MIKAVVCDVDGVLVESFVWARILEETHGLSRERTAPFFHGPFMKCLTGELRLREELEPFMANWGWPATVDDFIARWFEAESVLDTGVLEIVGRLRSGGLACYVASNQEAERAAYLRDTVGLADRFDGFFFSSALRVRKPDGRFFEMAARSIGVDPAQILFVDDQQANVDAARAAGWRAELYRIGDDLPALLGRHGVFVAATDAPG